MITYEVQIQHTAGTSTAAAFDLVVTDALDPNLTLVVGSVSVAPAAGTTVMSGNTGGDHRLRMMEFVLGRGAT